MPGPASNFCWQMPHSPFLLWWSNARPPSPSDQYTKLLVAIFNKHNCYGSIELHKTGHEMSHSDWKKDKANYLIAFIGLLWSINALHLLQNDNAWLLETLDSERRRKMTTGYYETSFFVVCKCPGGRDTINCQMPGPRNSSCNKCRGFARGECWKTNKDKPVSLLKRHRVFFYSLTTPKNRNWQKFKKRSKNHFRATCSYFLGSKNLFKAFKNEITLITCTSLFCT